MTNADRLPVKDLNWLKTLIDALQAFRAIDPEISANQIVTLLYVAFEPGISQSVLSNEMHLDAASGTVARLCAILSERGNRGTPGKGLIEIGHAPGDYRTTAQKLTPTGHQLLKSVRDIMLR